MLRFLSFGSGSSGNCYLLFTENDALMIDAGVGVRSLKKYARDFGINMSLLHNLIITHDHADHIKCVGSLSHDFHLPVWATEEVHKGIDRNYCVSRKVDVADRHVMQPGVTVHLGEFEIIPFNVPHDSSDNVGYMINACGINICIITDAGCVTNEMGTFIQQSNYLIIEANHDTEMLMCGPYPAHLKERISSATGHLSNTDCAKALVSNMSEQLKHVWLCHLSEENNHPELARKTIETIMRSHGVIIGVDFKLDVLKRTVPTGVFDLV